MEKDFEDLVAIRCERALEESVYYMGKEEEGVITQDELQVIAEILCYKKGFNDAMAILKCSH